MVIFYTISLQRKNASQIYIKGFFLHLYVSGGWQFL